MLMVCTPWAGVGSCDVFRVIIPPAGAIFARVLSFFPPVGVFLVTVGGEVVMLALVVVAVVVEETES